ncbi:Arf guanine nucleotide exchange factor sbh1 [Apophysomyces ossiformis]|uniref:Arf guanine nucleotide exchange factor sbh1 n=1 Tax=Apophysomyces ossiformis TaxID=679940 RepID=A0A8H7BSX5_9FUNG|nr:Arf guanine nucleotide exchange factor sbh1 [Apophysomyces ossiformis]
MADSTPKGTVRRRVTGRSNQNTARGPMPGGSTSGMMRIYSDDSPGLRVDPVVVLVLSLTFIASVFGLHIIGKFLRA